MKLAKLLNTI